MEFSELFNEHGPDLISLSENIDTSSPYGRMSYTLTAAIAQCEREETANRVKASVETRAKLGRPVSVPVFGYHWNEKKEFVPHPTEAPIQKLIYELFRDHRRLKTVAAILNGRGYWTRKGQFSETTVEYLIKDLTAKGKRRTLFTTTHNRSRCVIKPMDQWHWLEVEPIVGKELWAQYNAISDEGRRGTLPPGKKPVHLFAGLATRQCGAKMDVPTANPKYVCFRKGCRNKIPVEDLEAVYVEELKGYFLNPEQGAASVEKGNEALTEKVATLTSKTRERDAIRGEMNEILGLFREKAIKRETFTNLFGPLEERLEQVNAVLPALQAEVDLAKTSKLSVDEILNEAATLARSVAETKSGRETADCGKPDRKDRRRRPRNRDNPYTFRNL